ncbi:MAG TPA: cob(I)yrinic acid a,c-diamide adenosyltransferase [Actinomycetota bacterium]|nr:cob(I)yrinic acid a,c-diamide adenosyltransferase [Actinomycetota bacterium]
MRIYTRTGDDGTTGLLYGGRVSKSDTRTATVGNTDEAVAALGLARSLHPVGAGLADLLLDLQRQLFVVGAELATAPANARKLKPGLSKVTEAMVTDLEATIDRLIAESPLPDYFVIPGATPVAAALDLARAVVRRAERSAVGLSEAGVVADDVVLRYLNRLSDLLFVAARYEEQAAGVQATPSHD